MIAFSKFLRILHFVLVEIEYRLWYIDNNNRQEEVSETVEKNKIKPDTILKTFWRDNNHFADLFNAALFDGEQVLKPDDLTEVDTDVSSMLKFNGHAETVQKILDVVKKTAYGVDFVIWGLENQAKIHYAMPLRHMVGDAFTYMKEYDEIAVQNRNDKNFQSSDEFLSNFKKTDRLHPVISLCVYYGEREWDGPFSLKDMLEIPEKLKPLVADYKMNLIQVRASESLKFCNPDVNTVFDVSRSIYARDYQKINMVYKDRVMSAELGLVIGAITESQKLIDHALESEQKGGQINMCNALEELRQDGIQAGVQEGIQIGRLDGIRANIRTCKSFNASQEVTVKNLMREFSLSEEEAAGYVKKYW